MIRNRRVVGSNPTRGARNTRPAFELAFLFSLEIRKGGRLRFCATMPRMTKRAGNITIAGDANVWPHEMETARALARDGRNVEFIDRGGRGDGCADVRMDGLIWEMKAPRSDKMAMVQKNIRRALHQSPNIVFDVRRMKRLPDAAVEREVRKWANEVRTCKHALYVNRHGNVIVIK